MPATRLRLVRPSPVVTSHADLAAAVGAWVALEMRACMAAPQHMLANDEDQPGPPPHLAGVTRFDATTFCGHIDGMLDDLVELCALPVLPAKHKGPVKLYIVPHAPGTDPHKSKWPDDQHEWQWCLCGHARIGK